MKKKIVGLVVVAAIAGGTAFFFLSKGGKTEVNITQRVDSINSVLVMRTDSVDAAVKSLKNPHYTQLDSLADVLTTIQWTDEVKDGGSYLEESKKNFENKKKEVAKLLKKAYEDNNIVTPKVDELKELIDKQ